MIRIDDIWLTTQPMDMRAGMDTVMAQVLKAFGYIKPHCAYLFCNKRGHNWVENQMRPWALGRKNWLFAGSLRSGQRAANIMTLIQSAKLNGLDPYAYLSDVLKRLPTHKVPQIEELLPHRWKPEPN
ncbi:transposase domain-containing protein [Acinetobacter sp. 251-1]|uniref:transposase domain-containing protein n=1 Tax=Acinetobacter sp. 251-1 TaxID=2746720 RepID=UPI0025755F9C|nr:transposase domain-containing protein [Acinetobacter sp. 251-1]MDM1762654.1 transposase domain-containing protein [Acinetobacter sp. 251-1]